MFDQEDEYNNPLDWWRIHAEKYPNIWKIARCVLAIPATSAPSERVFSAANIINKKRVRLKPETVDLLFFEREQGLCRMGLGIGFRRFPATQLRIHGLLKAILP